MQLDGFWDFCADPQNIGESEGWFERPRRKTQLAVPASWNEQQEELFKFCGKGWYSCSVFIPGEWREKRVLMRIGAAHYRTKVWLNGSFLGENEGGSLPFEFELGNELSFNADNLLVICVDGSLDPWGLPPALLEEGEERVGFYNQDPPVTYDFFPFSGIHRSVWLYTTEKTYIKQIEVKTEKIDGFGSDSPRAAELSVSAAIGTAGGEHSAAGTADDEGTGRITVNICIEDRKLVLDPEGGEAGVLFFNAMVTIDKPRLWDIGRGELYSARITIEQNGKIIDSYRQSFGIRTVGINKTGIRLNGRNVFLKGFGKHEDSDFYGRGYNPGQISRDFDLLRWIGANSFRASHYPYAEEVLDYADRQGILVIGETPFVGMNDRMFTKQTEEKALPMIRRMIDRDRNHPSIIAWSLANEPYVSTDAAEAFFKTMADTARNLDDSRPITYVSHLEVEDNRGIPYYDFICLNKYYGWYIRHGRIDETLEGFSDCLDGFHTAFDKPLLMTEFGADAVPGMHTWPPQPFSEEFQAEMLEKQYALLKSKDYVFGAHVWNFADFKTSQSLTRIIHNRKGVFTRDRLPKLAAHVLRRLWKEE